MKIKFSASNSIKKCTNFTNASNKLTNFTLVIYSLTSFIRVEPKKKRERERKERKKGKKPPTKIHPPDQPSLEISPTLQRKEHNYL